MQTALDFPQPLTERYRPERLDQFIGIPQAKRIASEIISRPSLGRAYLFAGESGTGKDCMKLAIARALNAEFHYMPARQVSKEEIERVWELCHYSTWTGSNWRVVGLPEADLMRIDLQQTFLSLLDGTASLSGGLFGVYHHTTKKHLGRYVDEFTFRLNEGNVARHTLARLDSFVDAVAGKRLTYKELTA